MRGSLLDVPPRRWPGENLRLSRRTLCSRYERSEVKTAAETGHVLKWTCQNRVRCFALSNAYAMGLHCTVAVTDCASIDPRDRLSAHKRVDPFPQVSLKRTTACRQELCSKFSP